MNRVAETSSSTTMGPQIRLAALSVYNWGSFHGLHTAQIDRDGTLITGDNGAGKSTLVDGLMALLLSTRASFNVAAAQGDRNDRSLVSYVRGSFGSLHDGGQTQTRYKRTGAVVSALRAKYCSDDGAIISLCGVFWTTQATNAMADFKRLYVVAERDLSLEELLDEFRSGDARKLKKRFRDDPHSTPFDSFTAYQERYRRLLHLDNRNAPSLLSRALGLKKIDDLTALVRELVLEPSGIREEAQKTVREFDDLVATHTQLVDARKRRSALEDLPGLAHQLAQTRETLLRLEAERNGLAIFFAGHAARLWSERKLGIEQELNAIRIRLQEFRRKIDDAATQVEARHADYLQAGGNRLEDVKRELAHAKNMLSLVTQTASDYQKRAAQANLADTLDEANWHANKQQIDDHILHADADNERAQNGFADAASRLSRVDEKLRAVQEEIVGIESHPDSNIDFQFQKLRTRLVEYLDIPLEELVFIGELVDVKPEYSTWQGAIERALGGLRTTLAVPSAHYRKVTRWLHSNHAGLHVRVQVVGEVSGPARFLEDGYLRNLEWRKHPYRDWLKHLLARFDLHCVATTEALHDTPRAMTESGLIHFGSGRYEKKDQHRVDDQRQWALGFSNKIRLAGLRKEKAVYVDEKALRESEIKSARQALDETTNRHSLFQQLASIEWQMIDVARWQHQVQQAQAALATLTDAHGNLALVEAQWQSAKSALAAIADDKEHTTKREGECERRLAEAERAHHQATDLAATPLDSQIMEALTRRIPALNDTELEHFGALEQGHRSTVDSEISLAGATKERAQNRAVAIMASFRKEWEVIAADWGGDVNSLDDYIEHLNELDAEGLPVLVEQFTERLNHCATQSLAGIRSRMESERDEISDRIETINRVLAGTEFRQGSYLQLNIKPETYPHVQAFNQALTTVFEHAGSADQEKRFRGLATVIEILEKASDATTAHTLESQRLIDPRYQLSFYAEELDSDSHDVIDVLHSSSGKSGGEKEAFAGTIVAAALAYVLTPEDGTYPVYCTVFLDEAFSNTAEAVSRRVLRVFRELNIHVNLITPFKNLNLARESARSLLIAERDPGKHESRLCEVTWDEIDRQIAQRKRETTEQAHELGVVLENVR